MCPSLSSSFPVVLADLSGGRDFGADVIVAEMNLSPVIRRRCSRWSGLDTTMTSGTDRWLAVMNGDNKVVRLLERERGDTVEREGEKHFLLFLNIYNNQTTSFGSHFDFNLERILFCDKFQINSCIYT